MMETFFYGDSIDFVENKHWSFKQILSFKLKGILLNYHHFDTAENVYI